MKSRSSEFTSYSWIKKELSQLGWIAKNPNRNPNGQVYTQQECLDDVRIKECLGRKRPEFVVKLSEDKFWIIEAKGKPSMIEKAFSEAIEYADLINNSDIISVPLVSGVAGNDDDGYIVRSAFLEDDEFRPVNFNSREITGLLSVDLVKSLLEKGSSTLDDLEIDELQLLNIADQINEIFHRGSVQKDERATVLSTLLLSLIDNTEPNYNANPVVFVNDINARAEDVLKRNGKGEFFRHIEIKLPTKKDAQEKYKKSLVSVLFLLKKINIKAAMGSGTDILGKFYEVFLKYGNGAKDIGIVFTPRHVTKFAAEVLGVSHDDIVYDPTCGTGGFLVSAYNLVRKNSTSVQTRDFGRYRVFGIELQPRVAAMAIINMIFRGDGKTNIIDNDCLSQCLYIDYEKNQKTVKYFSSEKDSQRAVTRVLMNPPFALKEEGEQEHKFVSHALNQMNDGGLLFSILPFSELIQGGDALVWRREQLLKFNTLLAVISFPEDLFYGSTGKHVCGIVVKKGHPHNFDRDVLWVKIFDDGYRKRKKKRIPVNMEYNDLAASFEIVRNFIQNNERPKVSVPRRIKACPISDDSGFELVPEVYLEGGDFKVEQIRESIQKQLRGILAFLYDRGIFTFGDFKPPQVQEFVPISNKWKKVRLDELFDFVKGYSASSFDLHPLQDVDSKPLFRPTSTVHNLIAGWIEKEVVEKNMVYPPSSLLVSTDGEGSHSYSHITPIGFVPNSNTSVLLPKYKVPLSFLLFISVAITNERWRFSYGRKPKSGRLEKISLTVPINDDGDVDFKAFDNLVESIGEYSIVKVYFDNVES